MDIPRAAAEQSRREVGRVIDCGRGTADIDRARVGQRMGKRPRSARETENTGVRGKARFQAVQLTVRTQTERRSGADTRDGRSGSKPPSCTLHRPGAAAERAGCRIEIRRVYAREAT